MLLGIEFRDEFDKQEFVEKAHRAKEAVCEAFDMLAEHMPELQQLQERRGYYNRNYPMGHVPSHLGYRDYGMNGGGYGMYGGGGGNFRDGGQYRENPAWTGPGDRRGY